MFLKIFRTILSFVVVVVLLLFILTNQGTDKSPPQQLQDKGKGVAFTSDYISTSTYNPAPHREFSGEEAPEEELQ
jgi:hypothetical protein